MTADPRSHISVGIDGRQYSRPVPVYIDVLGLPTITEAVQAASDMLRRGIIRAMASNPPEKSNPNPKTDKVERQKTQAPTNPRSQTPVHTSSATAGRDPVSVYSAVTKRSRKTTPETDPASNLNMDLSPADTVKEKQNTDSNTSTTAAWSSAKKAGPSILSKRNRSQLTVFQPSAKRERRSEVTQDAPVRNAPKAVGAVLSNATNARTTAQPQTQPNSRPLQPFVRTGPSKANTSKSEGTSKLSTVTTPSKSVTADTLPPVPSKKISPSSSASKKSRPFLLPKGILKRNKPGASTPPPKSVLKPLSAASPPSSLPQSMATVRSPGAAKLPSAWSQVTGKSSKTLPAHSPGAQGDSVLRQSGKDVLFPKTTFSLGSSNSRVMNSNLSSAPQELAAKRANSQLSVLPAVAVTASEAVIPLPSSSGLVVQHVPGSETIRGVRPNGYTVSREGIVKPVVTFSPKPKLPHKLRQTSVEKLFEGYRDIKKLSEARALERALREEQEIYADAKGRVEYRAAVTVRLKDVRK